jgi:hypothetical protein
MSSPSQPLRYALFAAVLLAGIALQGCDHITIQQAHPTPLSISQWGPAAMLPGTKLQIQGTGFAPEGAGDHTVWVRGNAGTYPIDILMEGVRVDSNTLEASIGDLLYQQMPADGPPMQGHLRLTRRDLEGAESWIEIPITLTLTATLVPQINSLPSPPWYPADNMVVEGDGFLLPGEGTTELQASFSVTSGDPPSSATYDTTFPATVLSRSVLTFALTPDKVGIRPGLLEGTLQVRNLHVQGGSVDGNAVTSLSVQLAPAFIADIGPTSVSRGQMITFGGRGFVSPSEIYGATTIIHLEGTFSTGTAEGVFDFVDEHALTLFPDAFTDNLTMQHILRVSPNIDGTVEGLGTTPGTFTGVATPWLLHGNEAILGTGLPLFLEILPQLQIVHVKLLPSYFDAIAAFGLLEVETWVRARMLDVLARDFAGVNITFVTEKPTNFIDYSIVEIGGEDPNGANLFGLDNTQGKDTGNLRFNDVIGGVNAETESDGFHAYGGIFAASFLSLSPTLGLGELPITSTRFDDVFKAVIPGLGGVPAEPGSYPNGPRAIEVGEAIRVLGNIIGNTITHEVGHSLGLAAIDGQFHNIGDNPGWIMDSGMHRPFEERAELDGQGPAFFSPFNQHYLDLTLPMK